MFVYVYVAFGIQEKRIYKGSSEDVGDKWGSPTFESSLFQERLVLNNRNGSGDAPDVSCEVVSDVVRHRLFCDDLSIVSMNRQAGENNTRHLG